MTPTVKTLHEWIVKNYPDLATRFTHLADYCQVENPVDTDRGQSLRCVTIALRHKISPEELQHAFYSLLCEALWMGEENLYHNITRFVTTQKLGKIMQSPATGSRQE